MTRDPEALAKLALSRSHASREVVDDEIRGWMESEQQPRIALMIV